MFELLKISSFFGTDLLKSIKLNNYPPINYEDYLNNISFRQIKVKSNNVVKSGTFFSSIIRWTNNLIFFLATVAYTISLFKNDEDSIYYGNFNGYFKFENKMVLDITIGYILYFTFVLKAFYTRFNLDDNEFSWIKIFRLFHKDIQPKEIYLNEQMAAKLWRSTLSLSNLAKFLIYVEVLASIGVYIYAYQNLPDYFKYSLVGFAILIFELLLLLNIISTFESFYFLFVIVCKYLSLRSVLVLNKMNEYVRLFELKMNDRFLDDELNKGTKVSFSNNINLDEFDPYQIYKLLREHDNICSLVKKYNYFWRFYLFTTFFTMPIIAGYFVFLLTFDNMYYIQRILLATIIIFFISYFYIVTVPAVYLSSSIQKTIYPLKLLNKHRLPIKMKCKIETYLSRFESKVSFNCYEMFDVISETYLDFFFVAGSLLFLTLQLFNGNMQYKMSLKN